MSPSPAELPAAEAFPHPGSAPPISLEHADAAALLNQELHRRALLKNIGKLSMIGLLAATPLGKLDRLVSALADKNDDLYIGPVEAAKNIPQGGPELIVHGGMGQQSSRPAAEQLFEHLRREVVVHYVKYPSGRFTASTMADGYKQLIRQRNIKNLALVGGSAGGPIAVRGYNALQRQQDYLGEQGHIQQLIDMPGQSLLSLDCSPASLYDAFNGELAIFVGRVGERLNLEPGLVSKFFFSEVDGPGDTNKALAITDPSVFWAHFADSVREVFNGTPEAMWWSQLIDFMLDFDFQNQSPFYEPIFPKGMQKVYLYPTDFDPIVDQNMAPNHWDDGASLIDRSPFERYSAGPTGHYDTPEQGKILRILIDSGLVSLAVAS